MELGQDLRVSSANRSSIVCLLLIFISSLFSLPPHPPFRVLFLPDQTKQVEFNFVFFFFRSIAVQTRARFHLSADCRAPYIDVLCRPQMRHHAITSSNVVFTISNCAYLKKYIRILCNSRQSVAIDLVGWIIDRSRRMRNVAARTQKPRSRCPAAILIHKSQEHRDRTRTRVNDKPLA